MHRHRYQRFAVKQAVFLVEKHALQRLHRVQFHILRDCVQHPDRVIGGNRAVAVHITDTLSSEFYTKVSIGVSTIVDNIKDLARSYKEAQIAIEVGKVFDTEKFIINYENLGIGRLIYQLPPTLCNMFLSEVFPKGAYESLDSDTLVTIQSFFENNLNGSETSRKLFVHRNTLVYRLDKVQKITGLDLRSFDDAVLFKLAAMVRTYLEKQEKSSQGGNINW